MGHNKEKTQRRAGCWATARQAGACLYAHFTLKKGKMGARGGVSNDRFVS